MADTATTESIGLVQQFVERTGQLYSLPAAAAEVLRLTGEPRIDPRAIKECLETDPALAARILRVVNSSLFGASRHVTDLNQALTLLGIRPLKMLVLGFSLPKELFAGLEAEVLASYWRHTLIKAVAARELSEKLWRVPGDEPFLAGLVQDIGVLALVQQLGDPYVRLLNHVQNHGGSLLERELEMLGFDHLILSARLLSHWGLPAGLCAAVSVPPNEHRIDELEATERTVPRMLHLADLLARLIGQPFGSALRDLLAAGSRYCGLTYEKLQPIVMNVDGKVEELAGVLSLQLPQGQSYVDLLLAAQRRMADEAVNLAAALTTPPDAEDQLLALAGSLRSELAAASRRQPPLSISAALHLEPASVPATNHSPAHPSRNTQSHDPAIESRVTAAIQHSRQTRAPLTLAFFDIDRFDDVLMQLGPAGATEAAYSLRAVVGQWAGQRSEAHLVSDSRLAILWPDCSRSEGVGLARNVLSAVKPWSRAEFPLAANLSLSAGLATLEFAAKNFPAADLISAALRCLSAAQLSGGDTVKSFAF